MKAVVVEDSRVAREGLELQLARYPDIELIGSADHPDSALSLLEETSVDVVFLDILMPGSSGFDLLENLSYSPMVVFTTAYSEHAIRSFDFNTVDYLLKPISQDRLDQAIDKLRNQITSQFSAKQSPGDIALVEERSLSDEELSVQTLDIDSRMFIRDNEKCYLVDLKTIKYFESCANYTRLYFEDNKAFIKRTLSQLEKRLPEKHFFRANRQYIINLHSVKAIDESVQDGYCLILNDGKMIDVSRRHLVRLKELLSF